MDHANRAGIPPRFCASKLIEGDKNIEDQLELNQNELELLEHCIVEMEDESKLDRKCGACRYANTTLSRKSLP